MGQLANLFILVILYATILAECEGHLQDLEHCRTIVCGVVSISNQLDDKLEGPVHDLIRLDIEFTY